MGARPWGRTPTVSMCNTMPKAAKAKLQINHSRLVQMQTVSWTFDKIFTSIQLNPLRHT